MTLAPPRADGLDLAAVRREVDVALESFLQDKERDASALGMPALAVSTLSDLFRAGGKRLRSLLCVLGHHAVDNADPPPSAVVRMAAALEIFHAFALIHDDIMDNSVLRRGRPTVHRVLADRFADGRPRALAEHLGISTAILVGDLALCWSVELAHTAALSAPQPTRVLPLLDAMRTEVMYGQYLDVSATGMPSTDLDHALAIIRYKTAKYTVERPLHLGALLAGASPRVLDTFTAYAIPLGEAFQLRDDLLGVFGDPDVTGKSRLDDLREAKHTVLIALALRAADPQDADLLRRLLGRPDLSEPEAAQIRSVLTRTGARDQIEQMIARRRESVLRVLARPGPLRPGVLPALHDIAELATTGRSS